MVRTVISMNSIDQALRDAHDSRDDDSGHPAAFREVYDQWMQFRAAQLKAVLREADYAEGANQGDRATVLLLAAISADKHYSISHHSCNRHLFVFHFPPQFFANTPK